MDPCSICGEHISDDPGIGTVVKQKGISRFIDLSKEKNDNLWHQWEEKSEIRFHTTCRNRYYGKVSLKRDIQSSASSASDTTSSPSNPKLFKAATTFHFENDCFLCAKPWDVSSGSIVRMNDAKQKLLDMARKRDDDWGCQVLNVLENVDSLIDVSARYHKNCYKKFGRIPLKITPEQRVLDEAFENLFHHIETNGEKTYMLSDLRELIGKNCPTTKTLCKKLKEKFGNDIYFACHVGRETKVYYKSFDVSKICSDWFSDNDSVGQSQKNIILEIAAEMIREEVKKCPFDSTFYPASDKFLEKTVDDIPPSLGHFLEHLIPTGQSVDDGKKSMKRNMIAHSILASLRSRSFISGLQLAPGTYVYKKSGSRLIIDVLSKLGVCSSYDDIQVMESSIAQDHSVVTINDAYVQYIFDNTDHNVSTLDGHRTFHCLGGIAAYTPGSEVSCESPIRKLPKASAATITSANEIDVVPYVVGNPKGFEEVMFLDVGTLGIEDPPPLPLPYVAYLFAKQHDIPKMPSWKGFMESITYDVPYHVSRIICQPFINEAPSDLTTINSSLLHAAKEAQKLNQSIVFVTYDQPLYMKAKSIIATSSDPALKNVVVRLGGFHLLMSYLGAIGSIMAGSGLDDLWSVVYAPNSVKNMLTGHSYARSVRAHILTFTALGILICKSAAGENNEKLKDAITDFFATYNLEPPTVSDCRNEPAIKEMASHFSKKLEELKCNGPTAQLWIQYFESVVIALQFIEAERLGNWKLHLQTVKAMLPLFHASGHYPYAKSAQLYLQDMSNLHLVMNDVELKNFTDDGFFTIRRSDKPWSGVWSDMTIEQTLNRFFGTDLTHGRGVTPSVVARYLTTMPQCFNIMDSLESFCNLTSTSSEQHVDLTNHRMKNDAEHLERFVYWLEQHYPFVFQNSSMSLSTGLVGGSEVNCHQAFEKGKLGMASMVGKNAENVSLSSLYKMKTLASAGKGTHATDEYRDVSSLLLFQRISVLFEDDPDLKKEAFGYELSPFPLSLFDEHGFMRKSPKLELYKIFSSAVESVEDCTYVLDGGFLLHKVVWPHGKTYDDICKMYVNYVVRHFKKTSWVVFDGYNKHHVGVKSYERYRRREKNVAPDVHFKGDMITTLSQAKFLSNVSNKSQFIDLLCEHLKKEGIQITKAPDDADVLIVRTAINLRTMTLRDVAVVGNDVDLLVLLIGLTPDNTNMYFHKSNTGRKGSTLYSTRDHKHLKPFILFAHAFAGCDTTSAMFGKGKKKIFSLLKKNEILVELIRIFYENNSKIEDLCNAAERFVINLYGGKNNQNIKNLRYTMYFASVVRGKAEARLAQLPPTKSALDQHAKRVYYQMQTWLGSNLLPQEWGWKRTSIMMIPIMSTSDAAPQNLLSLIFCSCAKNCATARCTCKKVGLKCTTACKHCNGDTCENATLRAIDDVRPSNVDEDAPEDEDNEDLYFGPLFGKEMSPSPEECNAEESIN